MHRAFRENFGENFRRERPKIVRSRSRKTRMKPSKTGNPLPKSQLDFESFSLRPLRYISIFCSARISRETRLPHHSSLIIITKTPLSVNRFSSVPLHAGMHRAFLFCIITKPGAKLIQFLHLPIILSDIIEVGNDGYNDIVDGKSDRGEGGFGSTGF